LYYKAKEPAPEPYSSNIQSTVGEEKLVLNDKQIAAKSDSYGPATDPKTFTKTWNSDEVPGGLVLQRSQHWSTVTNKRNISLTIWEPTSSAQTEVPAPSASAVQPAGVDRNTNTAQQTKANPNAAQPINNAAATSQVPTPLRDPNTPNKPPSSSSDQAAINQRYRADMMRLGAARTKLMQLQRSRTGAPVPIPADVRAANDRLNGELQSLAIAMRSGDAALKQQSLQELEGTLTVIEKFLAN
jgi:hypothetical protein